LVRIRHASSAFLREISSARHLLKGQAARFAKNTARRKNMKKQKTKKKSHKIETEQRHARPAVIAESDTEILDLAPQRPLAIESETQFQAEAHNH
jgi:hypothetical protein